MPTSSPAPDASSGAARKRALRWGYLGCAAIFLVGAAVVAVASREPAAGLVVASLCAVSLPLTALWAARAGYLARDAGRARLPRGFTFATLALPVCVAVLGLLAGSSALLITAAVLTLAGATYALWQLAR